MLKTRRKAGASEAKDIDRGMGFELLRFAIGGRKGLLTLSETIVEMAKDTYNQMTRRKIR